MENFTRKYQENGNNVEDERSITSVNDIDQRSSTSVFDVERAFSLCSLCNVETKLLSQTSSIVLDLSPAPPPTYDDDNDDDEECTDSKSCETLEILNFANEYKLAIGNMPRDDDAYLQHQDFSTFNLTGENCPAPSSAFSPTKSPALIHGDDVSKSFLELLRKSSKNPDKFRTEDSHEKTYQSVVAQDEAKKQVCHIQNNSVCSPRGDIDDNNNNLVDDNEEINVEAPEIYVSRIPDENEHNLEGDNEEINVEAPEIYVSSIPDENEHNLEDDNEEINVEAPRIYNSSILDDEIPRKKGKIMEDEPLGEAPPISELPIIPSENLFQRKRNIITGSETKTHTNEPNEIHPRKRLKIVDIAIPREPINYLSLYPHETKENVQKISSLQTLQVNETQEEEKPAEKTIPKSKNIESKKSDFPEMTKEFSPSGSLEIPLASKLMIKKNSGPRFNTDAGNLASSEKNDVLKDAQRRPNKKEAKPWEERHVDNKSVVLQNTEQTTEANESKRPKEKIKEPLKPEVCGKITSQRTRRNSSLNSWKEIGNAFATSKDKKRSVHFRKLTPLVPITMPDLKRLQSKVTKQRHSMANTLKNLRNLSSYMDRVRETILAADDDSDKELSTVLNTNETGQKYKIMVSTGTQTIMNNSPDEHSEKMLDAATQTEAETVKNFVIKTANAEEIKKVEVENTTENDNPFVEKPPNKLRKTRKLLDVDRATARAQQAILTASFEEFRTKQRI